MIVINSSKKGSSNEAIEKRAEKRPKEASPRRVSGRHPFNLSKNHLVGGRRSKKEDFFFLNTTLYYGWNVIESVSKTTYKSKGKSSRVFSPMKYEVVSQLFSAWHPPDTVQ